MWTFHNQGLGDSQCESLYAQSISGVHHRSWAIAPVALSLHYAQSLLDLEGQRCAHHRVVAVTVEELHVDNSEEGDTEPRREKKVGHFCPCSTLTPELRGRLDITIRRICARASVVTLCAVFMGTNFAPTIV